MYEARLGQIDEDISSLSAKCVGRLEDGKAEHSERPAIL